MLQFGKRVILQKDSEVHVCICTHIRLHVHTQKKNTCSRSNRVNCWIDKCKTFSQRLTVHWSVHVDVDSHLCAGWKLHFYYVGLCKQEVCYVQEGRQSLGDFFLVQLCFSELVNLKIGQLTMFQNITAHFRIETGLIFQLAAITGKGKACCLRKPPSIRDT